jgi:pimeloyl-ACP methyl ester carboxylesterase
MKNMTESINIVLVHGGWADGTCWSKIIKMLVHAGYSTTAVQLSLTSLQDDVETVRRVVEVQNGKIVLVGHAYGGAVITECAHYCSNIKALVYIAAFAPDAGESLVDLSQRFQQPSGNAGIYPDKYERLWIDKNRFANAFCADAERDEAIIMQCVQKPIAIQCFLDKVTTAGWKHLPSWYHISDNDKLIHPDLQNLMAERMNAQEIMHLKTSHASMITKPTEVLGLLLRACISVTGTQL